MINKYWKTALVLLLFLAAMLLFFLNNDTNRKTGGDDQELVNADNTASIDKTVEKSNIKINIDSIIYKEPFGEFSKKSVQERFDLFMKLGELRVNIKPSDITGIIKLGLLSSDTNVKYSTLNYLSQVGNFRKDLLVSFIDINPELKVVFENYLISESLLERIAGFSILNSGTDPDDHNITKSLVEAFKIEKSSNERIEMIRKLDYRINNSPEIIVPAALDEIKNGSQPGRQPISAVELLLITKQLPDNAIPDIVRLLESKCCYASTTLMKALTEYQGSMANHKPSLQKLLNEIRANESAIPNVSFKIKYLEILLSKS